MNLDVMLNSISNKNTENDSCQGVSGKKKSYLVLRKDGKKLRILRRSQKSKKKVSDVSDLQDNDSDEEEDIVYGDIFIQPEDISRYLGEDYSNSDLNSSDSDLELDLDHGKCRSDFENVNYNDKVAAVCETCGLKFKSTNALTIHRKWKHINIVKHECPHCGKSFRDSFCLKRHLNRVHTKDGSLRSNFKSLECSLCDFKAIEGCIVSKHYSTVHGYDTTEEKIRFSTFKEFETWKNFIERKTKSKFVKMRGSRINQNGTRVSVYNCHRSGYYNSAVKDRVRKIKSKGTNKINGYCPATMSCIVYNNQAIVTFMPLHVGHDFDVNKLSLTNQDKHFIADKLSNNIPMEQILEDLNQLSDSDDMNRINLTTRKDFYNIIQKYKLKDAVYSQSKYEWRKLQSWVEETNNHGNVIRFYKPHGKVIQEYPDFKREDFALILASDEQLEFLKHYSNNVVCVDNVSKVNVNDFELYSIIVLDEFRQSYPCAFILSSRADDNALKNCFKVIKNCINCELYPRHFVSDYANSIYNAWTSTFIEKPIRNLFSSLNIESEWEKNIMKIKSKEKQIHVLERIKPLLSIRHFQQFEELASNLIKDLSFDIDCRVYSNYLLKFIMDFQPWACCCRLNAEINNSLNLKDFHKCIEYFQVKGKKVKSICKTVNALLKFTNEKLIERLDASNQELVEEKIKIIDSRHRMSINLQETVIEILDNGWNVVMNEENLDDKYFVFKDDVECPCSLKCTECRVCTHAYSCTCIDATDHLNMCQHIHLIVTCLQNNTLIEPPATEILEVEVVNHENISDEDTMSQSNNPSGNNLRTKKFNIIYKDEQGECDYQTVISNKINCERVASDTEIPAQCNVEIKSEYDGSGLRSYYSQGELIFEDETMDEVIIKEEIEDDNEGEQIAMEVVVES